MIDFQCPKCGSPIHVSDTAAGKTGKCKKCGHAVLVPAIAPATAARQSKPKLSPRHSIKIACAGIVLAILSLSICWTPILGWMALPIAAAGFSLSLYACAGYRLPLLLGLIGACCNLCALGILAFSFMSTLLAIQQFLMSVQQFLQQVGDFFRWLF